MTENNEAQKTESADTNPDAGSVGTAASILDAADAISKKLEAQIQTYGRIAERIEGAAARVLLGGRAAAGAPPKTPEQIAEEEEDKKVQELISRYKK